MRRLAEHSIVIDETMRRYEVTKHDGTFEAIHVGLDFSGAEEEEVVVIVGSGSTKGGGTGTTS